MTVANLAIAATEDDIPSKSTAVVNYTFEASTPLSASWNVTPNPNGPAAAPADGYLRYQVQNQPGYNQWLQANLTDEYRSEKGLALTFRVRANTVQGSEVKFTLSCGVILRFSDGGNTVNYCWWNGNFQQLAASAVRADGTWHDIVMVITNSTLTLVEDGASLFSWNTRIGATVTPTFSMQVLDQGASLSFDLGEIFVLPPAAPSLQSDSPWDYPILGVQPPVELMSFRTQSGGPQVSFQPGFVEFLAAPQAGTNIWSYLDISGSAERAVFSYAVRVNMSGGSETKLTFPGDNILRMTNDGQAVTWNRWDNGFTQLAPSSVRAGQNDFTLVTLVTSAHAICVFENGVFLYSRAYPQAQAALSPGLSVQHLDPGTSVSVDIGGLRAIPSTKPAVSFIDSVRQQITNYFSHLSGETYVRVLDTPHVWGMAFGPDIMQQARLRQQEFERAIVEIVSKTKYRCDLSSLNSPDPDWIKVILGAIDTAMSTPMDRIRPTQFRFLFGQTPTTPIGEPVNYAEFKAALIRLFRERSEYWEVKPEIWMCRFYRLEEGIVSALQAKVFGGAVIGSVDTKMTWNHTKIIGADGAEALVGGHNLNMDLFRSYPPVHDVSVVVHGDAAYGAQLFLNNMWTCGPQLVSKETLDTDSLSWMARDSDPNLPGDPLELPDAAAYMRDRQQTLIALHRSGHQTLPDVPPPSGEQPVPPGTRDQDLQTLTDLNLTVFQERISYNTYAGFSDYKQATRMLALGKYWTGAQAENFQKASEVMKEYLIKNAKRTIRMSQMDLVSAWKKNWSDHVVCIWILEALLANPSLQVQIVVSPLDAGAGAEGDQYSFGSGASRTFDLMQYYMMHDAATDSPLPDPDGARANALTRLQVAPLYYTDQVPPAWTIEGETYKWPDLSREGNTATLKQYPLSKTPPVHGVIGSAAMSVINASGYIHNKVPSAPGNHAKIMIVDDEVYVVGSDNLYPGFLSEVDYMVEGAEAVSELMTSYWTPLWKYSSPHSLSGASPT